MYRFLHDWLSLRDIARRLKRDHTTIGREIKRNSIDRWWWVVVYKPLEAERKRLQRKWKANITHIKLLKNNALRCKVLYLLQDKQKDWWPDEILWRLALEWWKVVSTSTLYRYMYLYAPEWRRYLLHKSYGYKKKYMNRKKWWMYRDLPLITARSEANEQRQEIWHRENDTVLSSWSWWLVTSVDRKSRHLLMRKICNLKAATVYWAMMYMLYKETIKSLTIDNWVEFAEIRKFKTKGILLYHCNTYASYEKWTNERTNGLVRRYVPKGCDISEYTDEEIQSIENRINHKPRKILDYRTPYEVHHNQQLTYLT